MYCFSERDVILPNYVWRVAIDLDDRSYEDVITTISSDLMLVNKQKNEFTPIPDLKQFENILNNLEFRLLNFRQILHKLHSRQGILKLGGTILKIVFGVATVSDMHLLYKALDDLKSKDIDIVHSLSNQVIYNRNLDLTVWANSDAILNVSTIVKNKIVQSHVRYLQIVSDIWLNVTIYSQSVLDMVFRQLEFALLQLTQRIDELLAAVQYILLGNCQ